MHDNSRQAIIYSDGLPLHKLIPDSKITKWSFHLSDDIPAKAATPPPVSSSDVDN
jgi:hypothetical protein